MQLNASSPARGPADTQPDDQRTADEATGRGFRHAVRAFRSRDFSIFFAAGLVSNSGTWLQNVTVPYVLYELTHSATWVGLATFAQFIPSMLTTPLGGSLADRYDRRRVLMATQTLMAVGALVLWAVWSAGVHDKWIIMALVAASGVFSGLNVPSWQSFVVELVPRHHLLSAVTLNSLQYNASRAIGPAVAGVLLATLGAGWSFLLNGLSFGAVILALVFVRAHTTVVRTRPEGSTLAQFKAAAAYARERTAILVAIGVSFSVSFLGQPVSGFAVVFADDVFHAGAFAVGLLTASLGIGAVLCAPFLGGWGEALRRADLVFYATLLYAGGMLIFGLGPVFPLAVLGLGLCGAGFLAVVSTTNTSIQMLVDEHMRGRVVALRILFVTGAYPTGALVQGWIADIVGPRATVTGAGLLLLGVAFALRSHPTLGTALNATPPPAPTPAFSPARPGGAVA